MKKKQNRNLYSRFIQCNLVFTWSRWKKTVLSLYSSKQIIIYSFFNRSAICWVRQRRCGIYFIYSQLYVYVFVRFLLVLTSFTRTARDSNFVYAHHITNKSTFDTDLGCSKFNQKEEKNKIIYWKFKWIFSAIRSLHKI